MTEFLLALSVVAFYAALVWAIATPVAKGGQWLWLGITAMCVFLALFDLVWSVLRVVARCFT